MNPDEILKKALSLAQAMTEARATPSQADATQLAELLLAMDRHFSVGGKLPARWAPLPNLTGVTGA
jgi:hypothetical protein